MKTLNELSDKLNKYKFYERFFIVFLLGALALWIFEIFSFGGQSDQIDLFYGRLTDFLADATNVVGYSAERNVYECTYYTGLGEKAYPPLTYMGMYFFSRLVNMNPYFEQNSFLDMYKEPLFLFFLILTMIFWMILFYELIRSVKSGSTITKLLFCACILFSYPMIYSLERANTIIPTAFFITLYIMYYDSDHKVMKELALISLAFAVAFKMTPAVLGILLLYKKDWKSALRAVLYGIIIGIGPFFFFEGGLSNLFKMFRNMQYNLELYPSTDGCTILSSMLTFKIPYSETLETICTLSTYAVCALFLICTPLLKKKWQQVLAITLVLLILPSHSGTYCIIYLIPACLLFMNEEKHKLTELLILFGYILVFYTYQDDLRSTYLSYNMSIMIFVIFIAVQCIFVLVNTIKRIPQKIKKEGSK